MPAAAQPSLTEMLVDDANIRSVNLLRVEASMRAKIVQMLRELERELIANISDVIATDPVTAARLKTLLSQVRKTIGSHYANIYDVNAEDLGKVAQAHAYQMINTVNGLVGAELMSLQTDAQQLQNLVTNTPVMGRYLEEWWTKQSTELFSRFTQQMRLGMLQGEGVNELVQRVRGTRALGYTDAMMRMPTYQAEALVRTATVSVANTGRMQAYVDNADVLEGIQWLATLDDRICEICMALDGAMWALPDSSDPNKYGDYESLSGDKDFPGPTAHVNCRCVQVPVVKSYKDIVKEAAVAGDETDNIDPEMRASMDGQVADTDGFEGWLKSKDASFQDELLGTEKAQAFRAGEISIKDLTDQSNRPLSSDELLASVTAKPEELQFASVKEANAWANKNMPLKGAFTDDERLAMSAYQSGKFQFSETELRTGEAIDSSRQWILDGLDSAIKKSTLPNNIVVYRVDDISSIADYKVGDTIRDKAFTSTTMSKDVLKKFEEGYPIPVTIEYHAPEGAHALFPAGATGQYKSEAEILLDRNVPFTVRSITPTEGGGAVVVLEKASPLAARAARMEYMTDAPIVKMEYLGGGIEKTYKITYEDGSHGVFKHAAYENELATSKIAEIGGVSDLVPVASEREITEQEAIQLFKRKRGESSYLFEEKRDTLPGIGSVADFVEHGTVADSFNRDSPARWNGETDFRRAAAFDYMIGARDRHTNNWMLQPPSGTQMSVSEMELNPTANKLRLIDNGWTFPSSTNVNINWQELVDHAMNQNMSIPKELVSSWIDSWPRMEEYLNSAGFSQRSIEGMHIRLLELQEKTSFNELTHFIGHGGFQTPSYEGFGRTTAQERAAMTDL